MKKKFFIPLIAVLFLPMTCLMGCEFEIGVPVSKIEVYTDNAKVEYVGEQAFSADGLVVKAIFENQTKEKITDYTVDSTAFRKGIAGTYEIKINWKEFSCSYTVIVKNAQSSTPEITTFSAFLDEVQAKIVESGTLPSDYYSYITQNYFTSTGFDLTNLCMVSNSEMDFSEFGGGTYRYRDTIFSNEELIYMQSEMSEDGGEFEIVTKIWAYRDTLDIYRYSNEYGQEYYSAQECATLQEFSDAFSLDLAQAPAPDFYIPENGYYFILSELDQISESEVVDIQTQGNDVIFTIEIYEVLGDGEEEISFVLTFDIGTKMLKTYAIDMSYMQGSYTFNSSFTPATRPAEVIWQDSVAL